MCAGGVTAPTSSARCAAHTRGAAVYVLLVVATLVTSVSAQVPPTVKILDLYYTAYPIAINTVRAYKTGFLASLWSRNKTVGDGLKVEFISRETATTVTGVPDVIDEAIEKHPDILVAFGPSSDYGLFFAMPALQNHNLVAFSPTTGTVFMRYWDPHFYFLRLDPVVSVAFLVQYALTRLRVRRLSFMYLTDFVYGDLEYVFAQRLMRKMGYSLTSTFALSGVEELGPGDAEFQAEWEAFADTRPQAVIICGVLSPTTIAFVNSMLTDNRTAGAFLLVPNSQLGSVAAGWKAAVASGVTLRRGQIVSTTSYPLASETQYTVVQRFRSSMLDYLTNSNQTMYNDTQHFRTDPFDGDLMLTGWIAGEVLAQALSTNEWARSRAAFGAALFNQRRYVVDEIVVGDFGGECSKAAAADGAVCQCNQGGRTVGIKRSVSGTFNMESDRFVAYKYPRGECYFDVETLNAPANAIMIEVTDGTILSSIFVRFMRGQSAAVVSDGSSRHEYSLMYIQTTTSGAVKALKTEEETYITDIFTGFALEEILVVPNLIFIDPVFL
ncbi:receptor-type adenylate cyclase, partial [Trypanosoma grayi]|uniref:receptor-type adenylate cyclase n=1 Tax=Trypanosoma grayi TaxID=71804 RepID=UPI0004F49AA0